jgi:RNA polymerase sigma factor (sigma-70 family)
MISSDPIPTRYSLLSRLRNWDDQESWKDFFNTYWRLIYSLAIRSGLSGVEAQDVVQEVIICVAKDIVKFQRDRSKGTFKGWLRNIIRWRIADQLRKRLPGKTGDAEPATHESELPLEEIADASLDPLDAAWDQEWHENLLRAAAERVKYQVKEEHYQIFDLYVLKEWPVGKIAKVLDVSAGQVYLAKHRVAALIKKEIQRLESKGI